MTSSNEEKTPPENKEGELATFSPLARQVKNYIFILIFVLITAF